MRARHAKKIRAGILAAQQVIRYERVERAYDEGTLFGQAYQRTLDRHYQKRGLGWMR